MSSCSNCGFRSLDKRTFRFEKGGLFARPQRVCVACRPYQATLRDVRTTLGLVFMPMAFCGVILVRLVGDQGNAAFIAFLFGLPAFLSLPLCIFIHEAGHAFAARLMGQEILQARIGLGPVKRIVRLWGVDFEIRRYSYAGGSVRHFCLRGPATRLQRAFITAAGPLANFAAAGVAGIVAGGLGRDEGAGQMVLALFGGFAFPQVMMGIYNLIPSRFGDENPVASDGQQLLNLLKRRPDGNPERNKPMLVSALFQLRRYDEAIAMATIGLWDSPYKFVFVAQIVNGLSRSKGDRAVLDFYLAHRDKLGSADLLGYRPWILATVAWSALKLGDPAYDAVADSLSGDALAAAPDTAEMQATRGAWLIYSGDNDAGLKLMIPAVREIDSLIDRSELCAFIARGWEHKGDSAQATQYNAVSRHLLERSQRLAP